jgi:glycosyltransferase involved in cell wall biosynthesis
MSHLSDFDAVFIYREAALLGPAIIERLVARKKAIIYQLDDPLFVPYRSPSNGMLSHMKFFGKVKEIIRMSKAVIVNSTAIRDYAEQYNKNVFQVPSVVDTDKFVYNANDQRRRPVAVGWTGSSTTLKNVKMIEGPLKMLSAKGICEIRLIGSGDFGLRDVRYEARAWNAQTEVEDLRRIQIGLVPLPDDNPWNPYKFIMKTAQYMALGIVPVGTPMASNLEVIRHGENGFFAARPEEWLEFVTTLACDHALREKMSAAGVADAIEKYSLQGNAATIVSAFRSAVAN